MTDDAFTEYCTNVPAQAPVKTFTDDKGWVPGFEVNDAGSSTATPTAPVVVPSVDTRRTRPASSTRTAAPPRSTTARTSAWPARHRQPG